MTDNAYDIDEARRLSALESMNIMDTPPDERFNRLARIAAHHFNVPVALITFIGSERQWFKAHIGTDQTEAKRAILFCNQTIREDRVLCVPDATKDDRFRDNPQVTGPPKIRFYAGAPIRTPDGHRIGSLCLVDTAPRTLNDDDLQSIRDIADCVEQELVLTDRGAIHAAHQASRYSAVLEAVGDAILTLDEGGEIRSSNDAVTSIFGHAPDELLGRRLDDLMAPPYRFRSDPSREPDDSMHWVDADGRDHDLAGRRKNGTTFHMQLTVTEMAHFNERQFVAIARDVTEQKTKEWFLDAIIENIPNMVFVKDASDLRFTLFNKAGEELIGAPRDVLIGKTDFDFVPEEQAKAFTEKDREVLGQQGPVEIWEEPIDTPHRGRRILHTRKVAIRDELGTPKFLLGISEDVTERKRIEEELASSLEETERASRGKSEFLAHMSHELRSPLNSIIGFSQIMRDRRFGDLDDRYAEYSGDIFDSASHLLELINEILDISRIEAGELVLDEAEFDIQLPIAEALRQISLPAADKNQDMISHVPSETYRLRADSRQIRQILINLLSNAVRFTPDGGKIDIDAALEGDGSLSLSIKDTGIGIAPQDIPKILEPFGQIRSDSLLSHEGTGLGLTLSKRLAELHGGSLSIVSTVGEGTTVTINLPANRLL